MKILRAEKKHAISRGHLGCLGDVATVNLLRGCAGTCAFCYARCLPGVPSPGTLQLYADLPDQLRAEIDRRRRPLPSFVLFCTASDAFLGGEEVADLSHRCLEVLLGRDIGVSLATRGDIPDRTIDLLARHAPHVRVAVPVVSLDEAYTAAWEPGTLAPRRRLFLVQRLLRAGIRVRVRIEPLIPFVNDDTEQLRRVVSAMVGLGFTHAMTSFLHLRPGVTEQIRCEAAGEVAELVVGAFALPSSLEASPQAVKFHHLPVQQRVASLKRVQRIAREGRLSVSACHCQNPGIPSRRCPVKPPELPIPRGEQIRLLD